MKRSRAEMMMMVQPCSSVSSSSCISEDDLLSQEMKTMNMYGNSSSNSSSSSSMATSIDEEEEAQVDKNHTKSSRNSANTSNTSTLSPISSTIKKTNKKKILFTHHSFNGTTNKKKIKQRKGVSYSQDGSVVCCRFCQILVHAQDEKEEFLYEDDQLAIFRPLNPMMDSHILVVPKIHIRNVNELTSDHVQLLKNMRQAAEKVLHSMDHHHQPSPMTSPPCCSSSSSGSSSSSSSFSMSSSSEFKFAFHTPPFNSIDHVHMHAFQLSLSSSSSSSSPSSPSNRRSYVGQIKYRTETWWCRSYEGILTRLMTPTRKGQQQQQQRQQQQQQINERSRSE